MRNPMVGDEAAEHGAPGSAAGEGVEELREGGVRILSRGVNSPINGRVYDYR
jgi:hypothetical protein